MLGNSASSGTPQASNVEAEPRLKYQGFDGDLPTLLRTREATRLCVSDKILALGTTTGSVHLLDYSGSEVKVYREHSGPVTDLSFDAQAEYLASCSTDGSVVVVGLYSGEQQTFKYKQPLQAVALDPRYGSRKTREFVYGTASGALVLSSKGWLGNKETILVQGRGPVLAARMAGTLLAWAGDAGIRVYDTATHTRVGKLQRPASAGAVPSAGTAKVLPPCCLYWMGDRELYCGWGQQVTVVRVVDNPVPASHAPLGLPTKSLQILSSFTTDYLTAGVSPFGPSALAVLAMLPDAAQHAQREQQQQQQPGVPDGEPARGEAGGSGLGGSEQLAAAEEPQQRRQQPVSGELAVAGGDERNKAASIRSGGAGAEAHLLAAGAGGSLATSAAGGAGRAGAADAALPGLPPGAAAGSPGVGAGAQPALLALKLLSRAGRELASDSLDLASLLLSPAAESAPAAGTAAVAAGHWPLQRLCACRLEVFYTDSSTAATSAGTAGTAGASSAPAPSGAPSAFPPPPSGADPSSRVPGKQDPRNGGTGGGGGGDFLAQQQQQQPVPLSLAIKASSASPAATPGPSSRASTPGRQPDLARKVPGHSRLPSEDSWASLGSPAPAPAPGIGGGGGGGVGHASSAGAESGTGAGGGTDDPLLQYKWWQDGDEPQYYIVTPGGVIVGRPRDGNDRVAWFLERGRYREALQVASSDRTVKPGVRERVGEDFLQSLVTAGSYEEAAALCQNILDGNALAWERWAYTFAQLRQLAALAPYLPAQAPRPKPSTYDMVLRSFLLAPADHPRLLELVKRWPTDAYSPRQLQDSVLSRLRSPGGETPALMHAAALLYTQQGQHEAALEVYLRLRDPGIFDYVARHALLSALAPHAAALIAVDPVRGTSLLVEHHEEIPPAEVVAALQAAADAAPPGAEASSGGGGASLVGGPTLPPPGAGPRRAGAAGSAGGAPGDRGGPGGGVGRGEWRQRLHTYLDWLFQREPAAGADFAALQVELYAEFDPGRLLQFLMLSPSYPLDHAYKVCEQRGLVREMVFVLGRMGSADKALRLIVQGLRDVAQAVEFVQLQRDDELWGLLITLALGDPELTGSLLDHAGGYIDPLRVVGQIPPHLQIPRLRSRLVKIIADFRTAMSLQQGCHAILRTDCIGLANRLYRFLRAALPQIHLNNAGGLAAAVAAAPAAAAASAGGAGESAVRSGIQGAQWLLYDSSSGRLTPEGPPAVIAAPAVPVTDALGAAGAMTQHGGGEPARDGEASAGAALGSHGQQVQQGQHVWVGYVAPEGGECGGGGASKKKLKRKGSKGTPGKSPGTAVAARRAGSGGEARTDKGTARGSRRAVAVA